MKYDNTKLLRDCILPLFLIIIESAFSSCNGFLDMEPTNSKEASTSINSASDAKNAMNGVLREMTSYSYYGRNFFLYGDAKGGDLTIYANGRGSDDLYTFNHTPTSGSYEGFWSTGYNCILQLNNILENIDRLKKSGMKDLDQLEGEAYTLRALVYFDLVRLYGLPYNYKKDAYGVPNVTTLLQASDQPARSTVEENYKQILADLEQGEKLLDTTEGKAKNNGYINYYGNLAEQARVKLYMEDYDGALAAAKTIIDSGVYQLYSPNEWVESWSKQFGTESIFELGIFPNEADLGSSSLGYYLMQAQHDGISSAMGWFLASDYFLTRLGQDSTDVRWGVMGRDESKNPTRLGSCYKYMGGTTDMPGDGKSTATAVNIKVIRLSEIYLIAAEASLHATSPDKTAAADYLNAIRKRSPLLPQATASTITDDMILDERSKELFSEGQRFFDLIRKNKTIIFNDDFQNVSVHTREKSIDRSFYKIVLPISQDEINANPPIAKQQNTGY